MQRDAISLIPDSISKTLLFLDYYNSDEKITIKKYEVTIAMEIIIVSIILPYIVVKNIANYVCTDRRCYSLR